LEEDGGRRDGRRISFSKKKKRKEIDDKIKSF
jgi:hypothetical protein